MKPKQLIIELIILIALYLFIAIGIRFLLGIFFGNISLDISLHDTYFSLPFNWTNFTFFPFILFTVVIYLIRAIISHFKKQVLNIILIISNLSLIILTLDIYKIVLFFEQEATPTAGNGWTIYPPLSAFPKQLPKPMSSERPHFDRYVITFIIIFILILVVSSILTGKNWRTKTNEPTAQ